MFERLLLVWLLLISALAFWWPNIFGVGFDPFVASKSYMPWMMAITMFHVGAMLPRDELRQVRERWPAVLFGTTIQYTAMPLLGWSMAKLWKLEPAYEIGLILVGCVPGAMASNVITMNARGHTSYSVSLTTASTMLSPIVVPLSLYFLVGKEYRPDPWATGVELLLQVVLPVLAGMISVRLIPGWETLGQKIGPVIANLVILWIIATVVAVNRERLASGTVDVLLPLLLVNVLGYLAGWSAATFAKLPESMRRALSLEVGMQNAGLGSSLALKLFPDLPAATMPTALYTFGCVLTAMMLARYWAWKSDRAEQAVTEVRPKENRK